MKSVNLQISGIDRPRLSGGERQRLGIAQAQVNYPDLLILDEPAASLDPMGRHDVLEVMERLRKYTTIFYSTHILEDVQRVSDTVCILNHGELVAQAPIQELLAGNGKVIFQIQTRGEIQEIRSVIAGQPWVTTVQVAQSNGRAEWEVSVSDVNAAEDQLLGLVMSVPAVKVTSFGQSKFDLEEVFMNLVGGNDHGKQ
jgi:ABC-2 type transport system ATP-binding protein